MSGRWEGSDRHARLPADWPATTARILRRDGHRCQWVKRSGKQCLRPASHVDHIIAGDDHRDSNLRSLCPGHHNRKSAAEGNAAHRRPSRLRPDEPHPGRLAP